MERDAEGQGVDQSMLDLALSYIESGFPVFPCRSQDEEEFNPHSGEFEIKKAKSPYPANGLTAATLHERIVRRWWSDHPDAMVGIPTGEKIGLWCLDIDVKGDGYAELDRLEKEHGALPETVTVKTASGGRHMLFKIPEGVEVRNRGRFSSGLDTRGSGGFIIAAGSVTSDGRAYRWENRPDEAAEAPEWLMNLVVRPKHQDAGYVSTASGRPSTAYVDAAVSSELSELAATRANRNNALNDASFALGTFVGAGAISRVEAESRLMGAALANGYVNKDGSDAARATINSGLSRGEQNPRDIPKDDSEDMAGFGRETASRLLASRTSAASVVIDGEPVPEVDENEEMPPDEYAIVATPFKWIDPSTLPRREFLYGTHLVRRYLSVTVAPGGLGKSSLTIVEALAMATGRDLIGEPPRSKMKVWLYNLEDDRAELERRVMAACKHYNIGPQEIDGQLFLDSGREQEITVAVDRRRDGFTIVRPIVDALTALIRDNGIDVLVIDPFVSSHGVSENDNGAIDKVAKLWSKIADETNCAIEIVHHVRKVEGREVQIEDARGAVSLLAAARSARVLNRMSEDHAKAVGIKEDDRLTIFGVSRGKANLAPLSSKSEWRQLIGVGLGNGVGMMQVQDHAPVVVQWHHPEMEKERSEEDPDKNEDAETLDNETLEKLKSKVASLEPREDHQSPAWLGFRIAEVMGVNPKDDKTRIIAIQKTLIRDGHFVRFQKKTEKGMKWFLRVA